jgi:hypothetical protein
MSLGLKQPVSSLTITTKNNTIPWYNMPSKITIEPQISTELAQSLIGLSYEGS